MILFVRFGSLYRIAEYHPSDQNADRLRQEKYRLSQIR
jgi:hypothetical protein